MAPDNSLIKQREQTTQKSTELCLPGKHEVHVQELGVLYLGLCVLSVCMQPCFVFFPPHMLSYIHAGSCTSIYPVQWARPAVAAACTRFFVRAERMNG